MGVSQVELRTAQDFTQMQAATSWKPGCPWSAKHLLQTHQEPGGMSLKMPGKQAIFSSQRDGPNNSHATAKIKNRREFL